MASSYPALWTAASIGHAEEVRRLLEVGGSKIDSKVPHGETALHAAVKGGHGAIMELLLAKGARVDVKTNHGSMDTALHFAVRGGHHAIVARLLEKGAGVDVKNCSWDTALHLAIRCKDLAIAILLLGNGADMLAPNQRSQTPQDLASEATRPRRTSRLCLQGSQAPQDFVSVPLRLGFAEMLHEEATRRAAAQPGETHP